jgi:hypothetical protein
MKRSYELWKTGSATPYIRGATYDEVITMYNLISPECKKNYFFMECTEQREAFYIKEEEPCNND